MQTPLRASGSRGSGGGGGRRACGARQQRHGRAHAQQLLLQRPELRKRDAVAELVLRDKSFGLLCWPCFSQVRMQLTQFIEADGAVAVDVQVVEQLPRRFLSHRV